MQLLAQRRHFALFPSLQNGRVGIYRDENGFGEIAEDLIACSSARLWTNDRFWRRSPFRNDTALFWRAASASRLLARATRWLGITRFSSLVSRGSSTGQTAPQQRQPRETGPRKMRNNRAPSPKGVKHIFDIPIENFLKFLDKENIFQKLLIQFSKISLPLLLCILECFSYEGKTQVV